MKKRMISMLLAFAMVMALLPQVASATDNCNEGELYTEYLLNGGYDEIADTEIKKAYLEVASCLIDIDADGVDELLISLTHTEYSGPRGYHTDYALLDIDNGKVRKAIGVCYGGGTMGGGHLVLKYDSICQKYVAAVDGYTLALGERVKYLTVYSSDGHAEEYSVVSHYFDLTQWEDVAAEIREETNLFVEEGNDFTYYTVNDEYVSEEEYDTYCDRFIDADNAEYQMIPGTYDEPIKNDTKKESAEEPTERPTEEPTGSGQIDKIIMTDKNGYRAEFSFTYDARGLLTAVKEAVDGTSWSFHITYDRDGRCLTNEIAREEYSYNENGDLSTSTQKLTEGITGVTTYYYDDLGQLTHAVASTGYPPDTVIYYSNTYDSSGRLIAQELQYDYSSDGTSTRDIREEYDYESCKPFAVETQSETVAGILYQYKDLVMMDYAGMVVWKLSDTFQPMGWERQLSIKTEGGRVVSADDGFRSWEFFYSEPMEQPAESTEEPTEAPTEEPTEEPTEPPTMPTETETEDFFVIGTDTNAFYHTFSSFGYNSREGADKTDTVGNEYVTTQVYYDRLIDGLWWGGRNKLKYEMEGDGEWSGACFGIALSMLWANVGEIDATDFHSGDNANVADEYSYLYPKSDIGFRDYIYYCHLLQHTKQISPTRKLLTPRWGDLFTDIKWFDFWEELWQETIDACQNETPILLGVNWGDKKGHALVICGYIDDSDEYMIFKLYDCNTPDQYLYLGVSRSVENSFVFIQEDGETSTFHTGEPVTPDNWTQFKYRTLETLNGADSSVALETGKNFQRGSASANVNGSGKVVFSVAPNSRFMLIANNGQYLAFDGNAFSGNLAVYDINLLESNEALIDITLDSSESFRLLEFEDNGKYAICSDDTYMTITANGAEEVVFFPDERIEIKGTDYEFKASLSLIEEEGNVYFEGECNADCSIAYDRKNMIAETQGEFASLHTEIRRGNQETSSTSQKEIKQVKINVHKMSDDDFMRLMYILGAAFIVVVAMIAVILFLKQRYREGVIVAIVAVILLVAMVFLMVRPEAECEHTWVYDGCMQPRYCSGCSELENERTPHQVQTADCENPMACTLCGQVFAPALGHTWTDATATAPKTCTRCGATEGELLPVEEPVVDNSVYLNELDYIHHYGKVWTMSATTPSFNFDDDITEDSCYKDYDTPGHVMGPVYDYYGNAYTYGLCVDGYEYSEYSVSYHIGGEYTTFSGIVSLSSDMAYNANSSKEKYFEVWGDGELLYRSVSMTDGVPAQTFSVDITGVEVLTIRYPKTSGPSRIATIFDGILN